MAYLVGTAGHVDHGKTSLIAALTGIDADRLPEEKARGMTIDIGFAYLDLPEVGRVSLVDVPGHERFIKNMLAGASGVDVALLCVAADEGVMPQTREHFEILRLLETKAIVVALTKCDLVDEETRDLSEMDVRSLLSGSPYADAKILRVSSRTGAGLNELKSALTDAICALGNRTSDGSWFLPIDRVFTVAGHGTVVTGTLARGKVSPGDEGVVVPGGSRIRIRGVQVHGQPAQFAEAGQRTALNVVGAKKEDLSRGQAIGAIGALAESRCLNLRLAPVAEPRHSERIRLHVGAGEFIGRLFLFDYSPTIGQVRLEEPVACARGQRCILRRYSPPELLSGGEIVTPNARPRRKGDREIAELLAWDSGSKDLVSVVGRWPLGAKTSDVCEALGKTPQELGSEFERLKDSGGLLGFAGVWLTKGGFERVATLVEKAILALHEDHPRQPAIAKAAVLKRAGLDWDAKAFDRLISHLVEIGRLAQHGADIRHPSFKIVLNPKQQALLDRVVAVMASHGAVAPGAVEIAREVGAPPQAVEEMWRLGVATGVIVRVADDLYYARETIEAIKEKIRSLGSRFTVAQFRDATGASRKYALPLLIYLDEQKFTKRVGDERIVVG